MIESEARAIGAGQTVDQGTVFEQQESQSNKEGWTTVKGKRAGMLGRQLERAADATIIKEKMSEGADMVDQRAPEMPSEPIGRQVVAATGRLERERT